MEREFRRKKYIYSFRLNEHLASKKSVESVAYFQHQNKAHSSTRTFSIFLDSDADQFGHSLRWKSLIWEIVFPAPKNAIHHCQYRITEAGVFACPNASMSLTQKGSYDGFQLSFKSVILFWELFVQNYTSLKLKRISFKRQNNIWREGCVSLLGLFGRLMDFYEAMSSDSDMSTSKQNRHRCIKSSWKWS